MSNEKYIVEALRGGSHEAFRQLYEVHKCRVMGIFVRLAVPREVADELFQRVFVKLWEGRARLDPEGSIVGYLSAIARNELYSHWRTVLRRRLTELDPRHPDETLFADEFAARDYHDYLFSLADTLPERCRQTFEMRFGAHMSYSEIAQELAVSERTVENQIAKALREIRKKI